MKTPYRVVALFFGLAALASYTLPANAVPCGITDPSAPYTQALTGGSVSFYQDTGCFPVEAEETVFLQSATDVALGYGSVGDNNDDEDMIFTSTTDLLTLANGNANIRAQDGLINDLTISAAEGYWFTDLIFSALNVEPTGNIVVTAFEFGTGTSASHTYSNLEGGNSTNDRVMVWTGDTHFSSINIASAAGFYIDPATTCDASDDVDDAKPCGIQQVKQIAVSGYGEVPVPAAAWLFGSGLIGLAGIARKRKAS